MKIYIVTDMEGISGISRESQAYGASGNVTKGDPDYEEGRRLLMGDVNAAIRGAFAGGATEVVVLDGHWGGGNFLIEQLDPRAILDVVEHGFRVLPALDETFAGLFVVGQHAMAGTINGFLDHTQSPRKWYNFKINGESYGELGQTAAYAGAFGVPLLHATGDTALCVEAERQFPGVVTTAVKEGVGWTKARCLSPEVTRRMIEEDAKRAMELVGKQSPWRLDPPIEVTLELAWSGLADGIAWKPGVERLNARTVRWWIDSAAKIYWVP